MIQPHRLVPALLLSLAAAVAVAQTPATPRPAHSEEPVPDGGTTANPTDAASPPLADPLKQQAVSDPPPTLATPAVQFIMQASMESLVEVQMAKLALKQSRSPKILRFAQRVMDGHRALTGQLEALARKQGTSVPEVLDIDHTARVQRLAARTGSAFDKAYAEQARSDVARALASYGAASTLTDVDVAQFATGSLPALHARASDARALGDMGPR